MLVFELVLAKEANKLLFVEFESGLLDKAVSTGEATTVSTCFSPEM